MESPNKPETKRKHDAERTELEIHNAAFAQRAWRFFGSLLKLSEDLNFVLLAAFGVLALGAYGFAELAGEVLEGDVTSIDESILLAFRASGDLSDPIGSVAVEEAMRDITALGGVVITSFVTLLAVGYYLVDRRPRASAFLFVMVFSGVAILFALKFGFARPRPGLVPHEMESLSPSFPSGHSATAAVVYLTIAGLIADVMPRLSLRIFVASMATAIVIAVGVSRVYMGVHWPTDVLAGWGFGATWAAASWLIGRDFKRRGWIERGYSMIATDAGSKSINPSARA